MYTERYIKCQAVFRQIQSRAVRVRCMPENAKPGGMWKVKDEVTLGEECQSSPRAKARMCWLSFSPA